MHLRALFLSVLLAANAAAQSGSAPPPSQSASSPPAIRCSQVRPSIPSSLFKDPTFKSATVIVQVELVPPGEVGSVVIKKSSGYRELDESVLNEMKGMNCQLGSVLTWKMSVQQQFVFNAR